MATIELNTPKLPRKVPKMPPGGWLPSVLVLALMAAVAVIVLLAGHPASDVSLVLGSLAPFAFLALGRRPAS